MRRAARRDDAEPAIVEALESVGASVQQLSITDGPDLMVGYRSDTFLFEVKTPKVGRLKPGQIEWAKAWKGKPVRVVRTPAEALNAIGVEGTNG